MNRNRKGRSSGGKTRSFGQFDQGAGQRYATKDRRQAMDGLGTTPPPIEERRTAVDKATSDLMEVSSPYIGPNRVVNRT
jgi:hypothetical protein